MMPEVKDHYERVSHKEFEKEVADASSLPAQTCRALAPESQEDIAMYNNQHTVSKKKELTIPEMEIVTPAVDSTSPSNDQHDDADGQTKNDAPMEKQE